MIENILIAVGNKRDRMIPVVEHAAEIADALSAKITLYHVYEPKEFESLLDSRGLRRRFEPLPRDGRECE